MRDDLLGTWARQDAECAGAPPADVLAGPLAIRYVGALLAPDDSVRVRLSAPPTRSPRRLTRH